MDSDRDRARTAELAEAAFALALAQAAPASVQEDLGMRQDRVASGVVTAMRNDPTGGFWNRALGLGVAEPLTDADLDAVLAIYDEVAPPVAAVQLSPLAQPDDWPAMLEQRGLTPGQTWVKFVGAVDDVTVRSDLRLDVRRVDDGTAVEFADVYMRGYGFPADATPFRLWLEALPAAPGWQCFGVWQGDVMIAASNLFVAGDVGVLGGAGTPQEFRGRGGQMALMAARVAAARDAGCRWVSTETGSESAEEPNPSLHNMRRLGLTELYERRNWIYRPQPRGERGSPSEGG